MGNYTKKPPPPPTNPQSGQPPSKVNSIDRLLQDIELRHSAAIALAAELRRLESDVEQKRQELERLAGSLIPAQTFNTIHTADIVDAAADRLYSLRKRSLADRVYMTLRSNPGREMTAAELGPRVQETNGQSISQALKRLAASKDSGVRKTTRGRFVYSPKDS